VALSRSVILALVIVVVVAGAALYLFQRPPTSKGVLKVGTSPDFPPFEYVSPEGKVVGFDIDLIRALAKKVGYEDIEVVSMDFDALIPALQRGQVDVVIAGMTITEERAKVVDFTTPYWEADQAIVVRKGSDFMPKGLDDLVGRAVGVQTGTTGAALVEEFINESKKDIAIKYYSSYVLAVQDLINKRLDAVVVDTPVASMFAKQYGVEISAVIKTGEVYGIAVRKGNEELLKALNKALEEFMKSREWSELIGKYFSG